MTLPCNILTKSQRELLNADYREADKNMMWILLGHAFFAIFVTSSYYGTYMLGIVGSMVILSISALSYILLRGTLWFRLITAVAIMLFTAIYIQQHLGRIEMHFHVFIGLAILTIYKDTLPMWMASAAIIVHHFLFNYLQSQNLYLGDAPIMVFSYGCGIEYVYLHGVMVIAEAIVLGYIIRYVTNQYLQNIGIQKELDELNRQLQHFNVGLEKQVKSRTYELEEALEKESSMIDDLKIAKEEADSANRLKSEFLANMSHEIRTPLNSVIGFSDLLEQELTDPKHIGYLQAVKNGGRTLLTLINDILDLSKIEAGHMKIEMHPMEVKAFVQNIMLLFSEAGRKKGVEISYGIDENIPEWIIADEIHLRQILINLISNAIKFTHEGSVHLHLSTPSSKTDDEVTLMFSIHDTGIGIPEKNQTKIFEAFIQNDEQDSRQYGGTGLGLAICQRLAHLMGGDITVESHLGEGSTFVLELVHIERSEALFSHDEASLSDDGLVFDRSRILIVDDIAENRLLLGEILRGYGLEVDEASDGVIALERIREHPYQLVFMDIRMPNMDGWEAMATIQREFFDRSFAVVAVTASVMKHDHERIFTTFDGLLEKPVNRHHLLNVLQQYLPYTVVATVVEEEGVESLSGVLDTSRRDELCGTLKELDSNALNALKSGDIDAAYTFADELEKIGNSYGMNAIIEYASKLKNGCESFDIMSVEDLLKGYVLYRKKWGAER
ncbi:MAG: ATP-binding protein [Campylobacterales bacterium]|nr:ATP-binding protein [Campylobacterales bacterium]